MKHFIFLMIICLPLAACQPGNVGNPEAGLAEPMPEARVSGTVSYRERILLRPGTRLAGNHADMVLVSAGRKSPVAGKPKTADDLAESTTGMDLKGQFSYLADAPLFRDFSSGKTFQMEMSHQFKEL